MQRTFRFTTVLSVLIFASVAFLQSCASSKTAATGKTAKPETGFALREPTVLICNVDAVTNDVEMVGLSLTLAPFIRRDLFCIRQLSVVPGEDTHVPSKVFFVGKKSLQKIGAAHGADIVIVGLLTAEDEKLTVQLRAYDLVGDYVVLNTTEKGKLSSFFKLERRLVDDIVKALDIELQPEDERKIQLFQPGNHQEAVHYGLGLLNEERGKYPDALIAYDNALLVDENLALAYAGEGRVYQHLNAPMKAMSSYEKAVAKDDSFAEAWYRLNLFNVQYGQNDAKALECCKKALEIAPRFGKARLSLGTRLHDLGRLDEAIEETKRAAAILRVDPVPSYNLGLYYIEAGDRQQARAWFERALRLDPRFDLARTELQKLAANDSGKK